MNDLNTTETLPGEVKTHPYHSQRLNNRRWLVQQIKAAWVDKTGSISNVDYFMIDHIAHYVNDNLPEGLDIQTAKIEVDEIKFKKANENQLHYPGLVFIGFVMLYFILLWLLLS